MEITFTLRSLRRFLIRLLTLAILLGLAAEVADEALDWDVPLDLDDFFSLSDEGNFPTWISSLVLFSCGVVLAGIARATRLTGGDYVIHWVGLSLIFFYISLDEFVTLHEELNQFFDLDGIFHFGWVIPAGVIVAVIGLSYLRFLWHLTPKVRWRFVAAGALFVGGALIVELLLGWWTDQAGDQNLTYGLIDLVEESMEVIGSSLFLYSLIDYLGGASGRISIALTSEEDPA